MEKSEADLAELWLGELQHEPRHEVMKLISEAKIPLLVTCKGADEKEVSWGRKRKGRYFF